MSGPWEKYAASPPGAVAGPWEKYEGKTRAWADVPTEAIGNLPSSAYKFGEALIQPILHPIETVKSLGNVGYGLASKLHGALGGEQDPAEKAADEATVDALGGHLKGRYGSMEALKRTIATDPVGAMADASLVLTGGGAAGARLPGAAGQAAQAVKATGAALDPIGVAASTVKGVGSAGAHVLGLTTGTGPLPIQTAYAAGRAGNPAFAEHMRGARPLDEAVEMAAAGVAAMTKERAAAYKADMAATKALPTPLDMAPIGAAYRTAGDKVHFQGIVKSQEAATVHGRIGQVIADFAALPQPARTAEAFDALKQAVGEIRLETKPGTMARSVADDIYRAVKAEIVRQSPTYARAMQGYRDASERLNEIRKTLSVNEKATTDTTLRKLQSVMRNNVNTNYGQRAKLADELAAYQPNIMPALAGQTLNTWTPRGIARVPAGGAALYSGYAANPMALAMLPAMSPRMVGEMAHGLGRGAKIVDDVASAVGAPAVMPSLRRLYQGANVVRAITPRTSDNGR